MDFETALINEIDKRIIKHEAYMVEVGIDIKSAIENYQAIVNCIKKEIAIDVPYNQETLMLTFNLALFLYAKDMNHSLEDRIEAFGYACTNIRNKIGTNKLSISEMARLGAHARLVNDPKTNEKKFIYECWLHWQTNPDRYKGKADFARDMLDKSEHLKSQKKIEDWCRDWEKGKAIPASLMSTKLD